MLSPLELPVAMKDRMSTELPRGKTIVDVFADFIRYLFDSTKTLFASAEPNVRWHSISSIELVLTHPNGWGGPQQCLLRSAAVKGGVVPDTPAGRARVHFVTEGESSFCFCAAEIHACEELRVCRTVHTHGWILIRSQPGEQVLIIDAGGGTIDISTYVVISNEPLQVEELYEPKCEPAPSQLRVLLPLDNDHFRLGPRWRACHSEGNSDCPRCVPILHPQTDCPTSNQRS
jgi:hypothetical protein